jgi:F0F1-type ATP synthase assembly protein I
MELIVPSAIGYWLDQRWNTGVLCLIIGAVLGFAALLQSLLALARPPAKRPPQDGPMR